MDTISWQEIAVRLLFAFILGSAIAIEKRWYLTRKFIKSNTQIAVGAALFAILASLNSETIFSSQLIIGISIVSAGIVWQKQTDPQSINQVFKLWCAGAVGSLVGFGYFLPAYCGGLALVFANLLFETAEKEFIPNIEEDITKEEISKKNNDAAASSITTKPKIEVIEQSIPTTYNEVRYYCQVICPAEKEIEVLAMLVQLLKEEKLIPTGISSKKFANNNKIFPEVEIEVNLVSDNNNTGSIKIQQVLAILKAKVEISAASWVSSPLESNYRNGRS
ncbi:MgtC/SapB family protein [Pleurocapsa sp. PCC 7319]|uniref:MgtC/SapB family protein n=1 Tax=Pleurocapsa sp. PCC 7319 TaxID=118161 RepID=UPI0003489E8E|nr:MgtC/SapB family protein [Pleurocapsa sp. PCC 7319]